MLLVRPTFWKGTDKDLRPYNRDPKRGWPRRKIVLVDKGPVKRGRPLKLDKLVLIKGFHSTKGRLNRKSAIRSQKKGFKLNPLRKKFHSLL